MEGSNLIIHWTINASVRIAHCESTTQKGVGCCVGGVLRSCQDVVASDDAADVQRRLQLGCVLHQPGRRDAAPLGARYFTHVRPHPPHPADLLPGNRRESRSGTGAESSHDWSVLLLHSANRYPLPSSTQPYTLCGMARRVAFELCRHNKWRCWVWTDSSLYLALSLHSSNELSQISMTWWQHHTQQHYYY